MADDAEALIAAQGALLTALEEGAPVEALERAMARCVAAAAALGDDVPRADLERAKSLRALLFARASDEHAALQGELGRIRWIRRWLESRRPAQAAGGDCDVSG